MEVKFIYDDDNTSIFIIIFNVGAIGSILVAACSNSVHNPSELIYPASVILDYNSICTNYTLRVLRPKPAVSPSEY